MTFKKLAAAVGAVAVAAGCGSTAFAQGAAPAETPIQHGAPINGLCIMSVEGAVGASTVGKYVTSRLQQIGAQVNAELSGERTSIETEARTLEGQRSGMDQATFEQRAGGLQTRANALQRKAELRNRELQATEQKALGRVEEEMDPLIRTAYQQKGCSILLQRTAVIVANPAMDITPSVITALNAKITQFPFEREHLEQAAAPGAAAAGAPPIVQTPVAPRPTTRKK